MGRVVIMSGVSGSGKSSYARRLTSAPSVSNCKVVSADDYFISNSGEYKFDSAKLSDAHGACFREFISSVAGCFYDLVIVDNTNLSSEEIAPYVLGAQAYGQNVEIITLRLAEMTDEKAALLSQRNIHYVSPKQIKLQHNRLARCTLNSRWKNTDIPILGC